MVQTSVHWAEKEGNTFCKIDILLKDGWPNLKCHKIGMSLVETKEEKVDLKDLWMERWSDKEGVVLEVLFCSKYKLLWTSPTPIVFQHERSWIKQYWNKNTRHKGNLLVSWPTDKRLNENKGTQRT